MELDPFHQAAFGDGHAELKAALEADRMLLDIRDRDVGVADGLIIFRCCR